MSKILKVTIKRKTYNLQKSRKEEKNKEHDKQKIRAKNFKSKQ